MAETLTINTDHANSTSGGRQMGYHGMKVDKVGRVVTQPIRCECPAQILGVDFRMQFGFLYGTDNRYAHAQSLRQNSMPRERSIRIGPPRYVSELRETSAQWPPCAAAATAAM